MDILVGAAKLIAEHGFDATSVRDILRAADVKIGALYYHFPTKDDIALAIVTEGFTMTVGDDPVPRLQGIVDAAMALAHQTPLDPILRAAARLATDQSKAEYFGRLWKAYMPRVIQLLSQAAERGELLPGVEPELAGKIWVSAYVGVDLMQRREPHLLEAEIADMNRMFLRGIATPETLMILDVAADRGARVVQAAAVHEENAR
ncbi:TetR family transcriptional regulator [Streptomyces sp. NPDC001948]